jgi:hypothetical protein
LPLAGFKPAIPASKRAQTHTSTARPLELTTFDDKVMEYPKYPKYLMTKSTVIQSLRTYVNDQLPSQKHQ